MPRFVILTHDWPLLHWDLMLESEGGSLKTWRLLEEPGGGRTVPAELLADHRPAYLEYEGPVGGDRGTVTRWDAGTFQCARSDELARPSGRVEVILHGMRVHGMVTLSAPGGEWSAAFGPEEDSGPDGAMSDP